MPIQSEPSYFAVCDECGKRYEYGEFSGWATDGSAIDDVVRDGDWFVWQPDGGVAQFRCTDHIPFCEECGQDAGEDFGERDGMCVTCWEKPAKPDQPAFPPSFEEHEL